LIGWTLLLFIFPYIASLFIFPAVAYFLFYRARNGMRNGVIYVSPNKGFNSFPFYRNRQPFLFWFFILFSIVMGIVCLGMLVWSIFENIKNDNWFINYFHYF